MNFKKLINGRTWNATTENLGNGKRRTSFGVGEECYLGVDGLWHINDPTKSDDGPMSIYFPDKANEELFCNVDRRFYVPTKSLIETGDLGARIVPEGVSAVVGLPYQDKEHNVFNGYIYFQ